VKIILNSDVHGLGEEGDVCVVKNGYGRNYLVPKGLAVPYSKGNVKIFEHKKDAIAKRKAEKREAAKGLKQKIEELVITIKVSVGDTGRLFGSVNNASLADALAKEGVQVERKRIEVVGTHVKMVGDYTAKIKLYGSETAILKFVVEGEGPSSKPIEKKEIKEEVVEESVKEEEVVVEAADSEGTADSE